MFTRPPSRSYICLQCQHQLIKRNHRQPSKRLKLATHQQQRWQSSVPVEREEERDAQEAKNDSAAMPDASQRKRSDLRFRHWAPTPTAELGVNVLGQPAEILMLPTDGRRGKGRRPREGKPNEEHNPQRNPSQEQKPRLTVQQALALEKKQQSPSMAITELRSRMSRERNPTSDETRNKYTQMLSDGFSVNQLRRCIGTSGTPAKQPLSRHLDMKKFPNINNTKDKVVMAKFILEQVWGHGPPPRELVPYGGSLSIQLTSQIFNLLIRPWFLSSMKERFPIAKIVNHPDTQRVIVEGNEEDAFAIKEIIEEWKHRATSRLLNPPSTLQPYFVERGTDETVQLDPQLKRQVTSMLQRDNIQSLTNRKGSTVITALENAPIEELERDLILLSRSTESTRESEGSLKLGPTENENLLPTYDFSTFSIAQGNPSRFSRIVAKSATQEPATSGQNAEHLDLLSKDMRTKAMSHLLDGMQELLPEYDNAELQLSAELGQVVYPSSSLENDSAGADKSLSEARFLANQPSFLNNYLSFRRLAQSAISTTSAQVEGQRVYTKELLLCPDPSARVPIIRIILSSTYQDSIGEIKILEISLLHHSRSQLMSIPSKVTDVKLKVEGITPIFRADGYLNAKYAPVMAELANNLTYESIHGGLKWSPIIKLNTASLSPSVASQGQIKPKKDIQKGLTRFAVEDRQFYSISYPTGTHEMMQSLRLEHVTYTNSRNVHQPEKQFWRLVSHRAADKEPETWIKRKAKPDEKRVVKFLGQAYRFIKIYDQYARTLAIRDSKAASDVDANDEAQLDGQQRGEESVADDDGDTDSSPVVEQQEDEHHASQQGAG